MEQVGGDVGEEPFDLVDPGRVCRGEVHAEPGVRFQPFDDARGLVGAVVIADEVDLELVGDLGVDLVQELLELDGPVPSAVLNAAKRLVVPWRT